MPKLPVRFVRGLRFRLTVSYVFFFTLLLFVMGLLYHQILQTQLEGREQATLEEQWDAARGYFKIENDEPIWNTDPEDADVVAQLKNVYLIADSSGNALGYNEIVDLKRLYRVSGMALLMRLRQLDVISEATLVYAFQTIARGWRTKEPDELEKPEKRGQRERARRFERLSYRALAEGLISLQKAAELLRLPVPEVEAGLKGPQSAHA